MGARSKPKRAVTDYGDIFSPTVQMLVELMAAVHCKGFFVALRLDQYRGTGKLFLCAIT
jgi:hypothetical protein